MKRQKRLTKFEKQWRFIKSRRIKITKREFKEYYTNVRKANRKIGGKNFQSKSLDKRKISNSIWRITNLREFRQAQARINKILTRNYVRENNERLRQQFYNNLEYLYTEENSYMLKDLFSQLDDNKLVEFMQENPDIERMQYASKEGLEQYIELIGLTTEKIANRIKYTYKDIRI
jgi:hypothetical protein